MNLQTLIQFFSRTWMIGLKTFRRFRTVNGHYLSGTIGFFIILSLVPFLFVTGAILGYITPEDMEARRQMYEFLQQDFPLLRQSVENAFLFFQEARGWLGIFGFIGIAWSGKNVVFSVNFALDLVMGTGQVKPYWRRLLDAAGVLGLVVLLFIASTLLSMGVSYLQQMNVPRFLRSTQEMAASGIPLMTGYVLSITLFFVLYKVVSHHPPRLAPSIMGAVIAATIWEFARYFLSWYLAKKSIQYQVLYGSVATFMSIVLWAWVFSTSIVIGACVSQAANEEL